MSNAMRFGKRSLAGLASGALLLSGIAIVAAQPAQAAPAAGVYCASSDPATGLAGTAAPTDISLIQPNCSVIAGPSVKARVGLTTGVGVFAGSVNYVQMTISGTATWDDSLITALGAATATLSSDKKSLLIAKTSLTVANVQALVQQQGVNTVTVQTSTAGSIGAVNVNNLAAAGDFTITGTGPNAGIIVSNAYRYMNVNDTSTPDTQGAAAAIVHMVDGSGNVIPLDPTDVTILTTTVGGGTLTPETYTAANCTATGTMITTGSTYLEFNRAAVPYPVPACAAVVAKGVASVTGSGVWISWAGNSAAVAGNYSANILVSAPNGAEYTGTVTYTVSSPLAWGDWTVAFDKTNYAPGETAVLTICAADANDRPVPDGLAWGGGPVVRGLATDANGGLVFNAPVFTTAGAAITTPVATLFPGTITTYQGCAAARLIVPQTEMVLTVAATNVAGGSTTNIGWAAAFVPSTKTASAIIGNPEPTKPTIMIEGTRGKGDNANMVFVEGTTTELAGKTVTPYFRFPGQTGFTAGTGIRTVDAQGNFAWERKTGKQIAVQFRAGDVKSNTVLIEAK